MPRHPEPRETPLARGERTGLDARCGNGYAGARRGRGGRHRVAAIAAGGVAPARAFALVASAPARMDPAADRTPAAAQALRIPYGTVRYDGLAYLLLPGAGADLDLRELCRVAADRHGLTRYGCAGRPTVYVALDPSSATAQMCYHALNDCRRDAAPLDCALYQLRVRGRFADLHGRERHHPELIADDYRVTQGLARHVRATRLHGVLYPSARSNGFCLAAFAEHVFCGSRFAGFVSLRVQSDRAVRLRPAGSAHWRLLHRDDLRRSSSPQA